MPEDAGKTPEPPTHGCMECKAPRRYTVEHFTNGNTGWRCTVCGKIVVHGLQAPAPVCGARGGIVHVPLLVRHCRTVSAAPSSRGD